MKMRTLGQTMIILALSIPKESRQSKILVDRSNHERGQTCLCAVLVHRYVI